jgi:hypothetical protein
MIRVKLISNVSPSIWLRQLPDARPVWGDCLFLFDRDEREYDWLVAYEDIPPSGSDKREPAKEVLACPQEHSLFVTVEPSSVKTYGKHFTDQFGVILTSQEARALPHRDRVYSQPAIHWFYGIWTTPPIDFNVILNGPTGAKTEDLSMVYSPKRMRHTKHRRRNEFMNQLIASLPEMQVFGRGAKPLVDKSGSLDRFRYHVAVENHIGLHHWTEKLADAFLGMTLPFYAGCPNVADYFPAESLIPIDMSEPEEAVDTIKRSIRDEEYRKRLRAIREARRRVLYEHNLFAVLSREIEKRHTHSAQSQGGVLYSRHALRRGNWGVAASDFFEKARTRARYLWNNW